MIKLNILKRSDFTKSVSTHVAPPSYTDSTQLTPPIKPKKNYLRSLLQLLSVSVLMASASLSHGAIIFSDDFARANNDAVTNNWLELEKDSNDVAIYQQQLRLRDNRTEEPSAAAIQAVSLETYVDIQLTFDWRATSSTEPSDTLFVGWQLQDDSFSSLWNTALGGSSFESLSLDITHEDIPTNYTALAIWIEVGSANETVYIDNFLLSGELATELPDGENETTEPSAQVPEPSSLALLLASLGLIQFRKRPSRN